MSALSSSRTFLLALVFALAGAVAVMGLPISGSPGLAAPASPALQPAEIAVAKQGSAAPAPPAVPLTAVPAALPAASPAAGTIVAARAVSAHAAPLADLLRRQEQAGLDCALTSAQLPLCVHGDDAGAVAHDHTAQDHDATTGSAGTAHGTAGSSTGTAGSIGCYGDGTSGLRIRAVYARPQSAPDRYAATVGSIRGWAAGVSRHFDTSAARTGGRRHLRFATTAGTNCTVSVLNVVLPDNAFGSFQATINALEAKGLDARASKYLIWADSTGYCGIASTYVDDKAGLDNLNNGGFTTYARVDRRCWGKVETHEVVHMLGGVQRTAPNSTHGGHCNDGTDLMCYADGTARSTQRSVCGSRNAEVLDCGNDDYFSTAAPRGSYLQTHWNTARSSFLSTALSEPRPAPQPAGPSPTPAPASPSPTPAPSSGGSPLLPGLPLPLPTLTVALPLLRSAR